VASLQGNNNSLCDIKTVSQGNDQQKTITNTSLPAEDLDDSDEIELTKNQNIELDLIRDLRNSMLIVTPDPIETPPEDIVDNGQSPDSLSHEKSSSSLPPAKSQHKA
ncbi:13666_t:CDS:1, partial [Acaulospora colombiana]